MQKNQCEKLKHTPALKCHHMSSPVLRPLKRGIFFIPVSQTPVWEKISKLYSPLLRGELHQQSGGDGGDVNNQMILVRRNQSLQNCCTGLIIALFNYRSLGFVARDGQSSDEYDGSFADFSTLFLNFLSFYYLRYL